MWDDGSQWFNPYRRDDGVPVDLKWLFSLHADLPRSRLP